MERRETRLALKSLMSRAEVLISSSVRTHPLSQEQHPCPIPPHQPEPQFKSSSPPVPLPKKPPASPGPWSKSASPPVPLSSPPSNPSTTGRARLSPPQKPCSSSRPAPINSPPLKPASTSCTPTRPPNSSFSASKP